MVIMVVTSLLMSTRYMYFHLTQTLRFNSFPLKLFSAWDSFWRRCIWVMLLLNSVQTVWPLKRGIVHCRMIE